MPDQKTQNPTGNNPPPQNPLANDIQAANEAAWLRLRDQAKTPTDVSSMMADLSAEDFNALSSAVTEAKRYGRKEVSYRGFNFPIPDKATSILRKKFEERQAGVQSQIEQANKGLGQQFFGTGIGGIGTELGKMIGIKPKKKTDKNQKKKTEDQIKKADDEGQKTGKVEQEPDKTEEKKPVEEEEFESSGESERGPTGTLMVQKEDRAKIDKELDYLVQNYSKNPNLYSTDAEGNITKRKITQIKRLPNSLEITTQNKDGRNDTTVLDLTSAEGVKKAFLNELDQKHYRLSEEAQKLASNLTGSHYLINENGKVKRAKIIGTEYIHVAKRPDLDMVELQVEGADGKPQKIRLDRKDFDFHFRHEQPALARELKQGPPQAGPTGTVRISQPTSTKGGTVRMPQTTGGKTLKIQQPIQNRTLRIDNPVSKPEAETRQSARTRETEAEKSAQKGVAKPQKNKYDDFDLLVEDIDKANAELEKSKEQMREILNKPKITSQDAQKFANIEKRLSDSTAAVTNYLGGSLIDDEYNDVYSQFRKKIERDLEVATAYAKEDSRLRNLPPMEPEGQSVQSTTATLRGMPAALGAAVGVAGAALGATLETKVRQTAPTGGSGNVAPTPIQVSKERKVTVSTQPNTATAESSQTTGLESVEVENNRKVTTSTEITPPTAAATQEPQASVGSVEVQHQGKITTQTSQPTAASPTNRQESRAAFRMPGAPPPSAPPTGGQPKGPSGPRLTSSADLLSRADQLVEQTKKFTSRMTVNSNDVMLKSQMRGLREQVTALRSNIANTQKNGSIFAPEQASLSRLDDRLGMIEGSLMGDVGIGSAMDLSTGLGLYDRERPEIGNTLSPASPVVTPQRVTTPRPTGIGAPSVIRGAGAPTGRAFPGPQAPRPAMATAPRSGGMNQMNAAMQLGAAQQQAALQGMDDQEYGEQPLVSDSSVPHDVRSEALNQVGGVEQGGVLPGQYAPRGYEDVYGGGISPQHVSRNERAPGANYEEEELTEEEMAEEGGELGSDEAERARVLAEQQAAARRASDFSGVPGMAGPKGKPRMASTPKPAPKPPGVGTGGGTAGAGAGKSMAAGAASPGQLAALLAAQKAKSVLANTLAKNEALRQQIEGLRNIQRNLENMWRMVNASELLSAKAVFPIIMWIMTSNLQMINKYSFKVSFIPPATIVEDGFTFCVDCLLGSNCLMNMVMYMTIAVLITLPYLVAGSTVTGILGALGMDPVQTMIDALNFFAK